MKVQVSFTINTQSSLNEDFDAQKLFDLLNKYKLSLVMLNPKAPGTLGLMPEVTVEGDSADITAFRNEFARPRFIFKI